MGCRRHLQRTFVWLCAATMFVRSSGENKEQIFVLKAAENIIRHYCPGTNVTGGNLDFGNQSFLKSVTSQANIMMRTFQEVCRKGNNNCTSQSKCPAIAEIFQSFTNGSDLTSHELIQALPEVLNIMTSDNCSNSGAMHNPDNWDARRPSMGQAWGYSLGFVTVVVMMSNIGACLRPTIDEKFFRLILQFLVAMGAGSLVSTSILVLLPEAFDIIAIEELNEYVWKATVTIFCIFLFFCLERVMKSYMHKKKKMKRNISIVVEEPDNSGVDDTSLTPFSKVNENSHAHSHDLPESTDRKTLAWMVIVGDAFHNLVDGLSIGAAFSEDVALGVSISLAVICETLPHELADIAILLHSGLSIKRALFLNFLSACFCYLGLTLGVTLGGMSAGASKWIFAMAGGLFLYVPLVDMLPDMSGHVDALLLTGNTEARAVVFLHIFGLTIGSGIVIFIVNISSYIVIH